MQALSMTEIDAVAGGDWDDVAAGAGVLAVAAGGAAAISGPAAPAFIFVAITTGLISVGASWVAAKSGDSMRQPNVKLK
jgi:hypothetical protein